MGMIENEKKKYEKIWKSEEYRRYSPGLEMLKTFPVIVSFQKFGVKTILDAGCGEGAVIDFMLKHHEDDFDIQGMDIAEIDRKPSVAEKVSQGCLWQEKDWPGVFDCVYCCDVLEHLPPMKVDETIDILANHCTKMAVFQICCIRDDYGPLNIGEPLHLTIRPPMWWLKKLEPYFELEFCWFNTKELKLIALKGDNSNGK